MRESQAVLLSRATHSWGLLCFGGIMSEPEKLGDILKRLLSQLELKMLENQISKKFDPELSIAIDRVTKRIEDQNA